MQHTSTQAHQSDPDTPPAESQEERPILDLDVDSLLINFSLADLGGAEPMDAASAWGPYPVDELIDTFEHAIWLLHSGNLRKAPGETRLLKSYMTIRELLNWAALHAALHRLIMSGLPADGPLRVLQNRISEFGDYLIETAELRVGEQLWDLTCHFTPREEQRRVLEDSLRKIRIQLEAAASDPYEAVVDVMRALVAAVETRESAP